MSSGRLAQRRIGRHRMLCDAPACTMTATPLRQFETWPLRARFSARPRTLANAVGIHYAANGASTLGSANLPQSLDRLSGPSGFLIVALGETSSQAPLIAGHASGCCG